MNVSPPAYSEEPSSSFLILKLSKKWEEEDRLIEAVSKVKISSLEEKTDVAILNLKQDLNALINSVNLHKEDMKARMNASRARQIDHVTSKQTCEQEEESWFTWFLKTIRIN